MNDRKRLLMVFVSGGWIICRERSSFPLLPTRKDNKILALGLSLTHILEDDDYAGIMNVSFASRARIP